MHILNIWKNLIVFLIKQKVGTVMVLVMIVMMLLCLCNKNKTGAIFKTHLLCLGHKEKASTKPLYVML